MKVCIAGYGVEGEINYQYWSDLGHDVAIADERTKIEDSPEGAETILGEGAFEKLHDFDLVIRTASLNPARIFTHGKIWSATNEFFAECPAQIIGVTGTKGKGTTCSLIAEILKAAGKTVHLVGNIGVPALKELQKIKADDIVVFELSSFQLWDLKKSPHVAVWLMMEPDHLNIHASMEEYIDAKFNITAHQSSDDTLIYHPTNEYIKPKVQQSKAKKIAFMSNEGADVVEGQIVIDGTTVCSANEVGLLGKHNLENVCAAVTAAWQYTQDLDAIKQAVVDFKGLPHRLELIRELNGVKYYDDSFSTGVNSVIAAIKTFVGSEFLLILGGAEKGVALEPLVDLIVKENVKVLLIGSVSSKLVSMFDERNYTNYIHAGDEKDLVSIVNIAAQNISAGSVLFSPGFTSYDMFKNEFERGDKYVEAVNSL